MVVLVYDLGPSGATFSKPVSLTMKYDPATLSANISASALYIAFRSGSSWQALTSKVDTQARTVKADVSHFTQFAVMAKPGEQTTTPKPGPGTTGEPMNWWLIGGVGLGVIILVLVIWWVLRIRSYSRW